VPRGFSYFSLCGKGAGSVLLLSIICTVPLAFTPSPHLRIDSSGATPDNLILVSPVARDFVFVLYLHCERFGLFVRFDATLSEADAISE
jgi:hypothetical protein